MKDNVNFQKNSDLLLKNKEEFLPGISIDNVIFGYYEGKIKILLNKFILNNQWMLPGGFIYKDESVDEAAYRILQERTGLNDIFLTQFHVFGDSNRTCLEQNKLLLQKHQINSKIGEENHWLIQRYISVGYYAFVNYLNVKIQTTDNEEVQWFDLDKIPDLYSDHNKIISTAVFEIGKYIGHIPIGYELLPEKFTMSELRLIHESFLGEKLDRRNFQRKMLAMGHLNKLNEKSEKRGIKPSVLFTFDKEKYKESIIKYLNK